MNSLSAIALLATALLGTTLAACSGGATGDPTMGPLVACPGTLLSATRVLNLDLKVARVKGQLTLNGKPFPNGPPANSTLSFYNLKTQQQATYLFSSPTSATYSVGLDPGLYDVRYVSAAPCGDMSGAACGSSLLAHSVAFTADSSADFDIKTAVVKGTVTFQKAQLANMPNPTLVFASTDGSGRAAITLDPVGAYNLTLIAGTYDVLIDFANPTCQPPNLMMMPSPLLPCGFAPLKAKLPITADQKLDLDVAVAHITGKLTVGGKPFVNGTGMITGMGSVLFNTPGGGAQLALGNLMTGNYSVALVAGNYDLVYQASNSGSVCPAMSSLPCSSGPIKKSFAALKDGTLDIDIPVGHIKGTLTQHGTTLADSTASRGTLSVVRKEGASSVVANWDLGLMGAATYDLPLIPGTYDIYYLPPPAPAACAANSLPCSPGLVKSGVVVAAGAAPAALNLDLVAVHVTGAVTIHPQLASAMASTEGVRFVPHNYPFDISTTPATSPAIDTALLPGHYTVWYLPVAPMCDPGTSVSPCAAVPALADLVISATPAPGMTNSQKVDVEVSALTVTGKVTLKGLDLPPASRGSLDFVVVGANDEAVALPAQGLASYRAVLGPANYLVRYLPVASGTFDCHDPTLLSCMPLTVTGCN